jgi:hypothetical protein
MCDRTVIRGMMARSYAVYDIDVHSFVAWRVQAVHLWAQLPRARVDTRWASVGDVIYVARGEKIGVDGRVLGMKFCAPCFSAPVICCKCDFFHA